MIPWRLRDPSSLLAGVAMTIFTELSLRSDASKVSGGGRDLTRNLRPNLFVYLTLSLACSSSLTFAELLSSRLKLMAKPRSE